MMDGRLVSISTHPLLVQRGTLLSGPSFWHQNAILTFAFSSVFPFDCLDDPASAQAEAPNQQALDAASSTTAFSQPPQLAPLRTDSPLSTHFPHNAQQQPQPTISISQPSSRSIFDQSQGQSKMTSSTSADNISSVAGNGNGKLDARGNRQGEKNKRASSLIASRDANLFVALGEALGKDDQRF